MNKIYKLIWSKVKNMWVVASELAKSHTKSPNSGIVGSVSLASLESKINTDLSKGFVAGVFPMAMLPAVKSSSFTITVAAIVKNEAENVPTWVQAARSCADEIVVVDTGSTDDTVKRFADYGIKCFHYGWHDDFASAKNYMISLCHGDWIVLLDGDEWFRDGCDVRKAIAKHHGNPVTKAIIADWICLDKDRNNAVMFSGGAVRAFRNQPDVRYFRKVHENLTINYENFAFEPEFKMYHTGYSGSVNRSKHERNLRIMRTMFDFDNGKVEYPTDWRYVQDTYAGLGDFEKSMEASDKMLAYGVQEYSAASWITRFNVLFAMKADVKRMDKEFEYCFRTVPSISGFRFLAAIYYFKNGVISKGLDNYIEGLRMLMGPQDKVALEHTYWRMYLPEASMLASMVYLQNKQVEAVLYVCKVSEQYCGKTVWTDNVLSDIRKVLDGNDNNSLKFVADKILSVLGFSKKAVLASALASSLAVGLVGMPNQVYAACCNLNGVASNQTSGNDSTVTAGENNTANSTGATVSGGACNIAGRWGYYFEGNPAVLKYTSPENTSYYGNPVTASVGEYASVNGGACNYALGNYSSVLGGQKNGAIGIYSTVSGGQCNTALGSYSNIVGGTCNTAKADQSVMIGGNCNISDHYYYYFDEHDYAQTIPAECAVIIGHCVQVGDKTYYAFDAPACNSVSVGGQWNKVSGNSSVIVAGGCNLNVGYNSAIVGGSFNVTSGSEDVIVGGNHNIVSSSESVIVSGQDNSIYGLDSIIAGGKCNSIDNTIWHGSIFGGGCNSIIADVGQGNWSESATIVGGFSNDIYEHGDYSVAVGGIDNYVYAPYSATVGGGLNSAEGEGGIVVGGSGNILGNSENYSADGFYSVLVGGECNIAKGEYTALFGGKCNVVSSCHSVVVGGYCNVAGQVYYYIDDNNKTHYIYGHSDDIYQGEIGDSSDEDYYWGNVIDVGDKTYPVYEYSAVEASVFGGAYNKSFGTDSTIVGGSTNFTEGVYSVITGGTCNTSRGYASVIAGGNCNIATGCFATITGGKDGQAYAKYSTVIGGAIAGCLSNPNVAQHSVAIGKCATSTRNYEVAIGSACAPITIGGNMDVIGTNTVTDGMTTKTWSDILNAGGSSGGSISYVGVNSTGNENKDGSGASGTDAIAIGKGAVASGNQSVSIGTGNQVRGNHSGAVGDPNIVDGSDSYVVGNNSTVRANVGNAFVLGNNTTVDNGLPANWDSMSDEEKAAWANGLASTDIMEGVVALGSNISVSLDNKAAMSRTSSGDPAIKHVVALGDNVVIGEENAVGIGHTATATALNALAIGDDAQAVAEGANAVGHSSRAINRFANASGYQAQATGEGAGAFGQDAQATANFATAFGRSTRASAESATAIGNTAHAVTQSSIAIGSSAVANGGANTNAVAIGRGATVGSDTQGYGEAVALGGGSSVQNAYGTALGSGASVTGQNSVALGYGSTAAQSNVVSVGKDAVTGDTPVAEVTRRIVHVADGVNDTDAVNVEQLNDAKTKYFGVNSSDSTGQTNTNVSGAGAIGSDSVAIGKFASACGACSVAIGICSSVTDVLGVALGAYATAGDAGVAIGGDITSGTFANGASVAIGSGARAEGVTSTALNKAQALGRDAIAVGYEAYVSGDYAIGIGNAATVMYTNGIAIGYNSSASEDSISMGNLADANDQAVALGMRSYAQGIGSVALGSQSVASDDYVVSLGSDAVTTGNNQHAEINRRIVHLAAGVNDTDAVNVKQLNDGLYDKANWDASNIGRNLSVADDEYPEGLTDEQKVEALANLRDYNLRSWGQALGAGTVTGGDARLITGDTLHVEVRPAENGTYVKTNNTTGQNLLVLDQQLSTVLEGTASQNTAISDLQNEMDTKANVGLDNITDVGKTVVCDLAKESVKVVNGTNTTVTEGTDGNAKTYAVNAVTDGAVADGNTGIVTGGTVYSAIQDMIASSGSSEGKANVALDNVTEAGHTVIKTDAKSVVNVVGNSDVTVTKTDVDGVDTYNVAVVKTGTVSDGNEGIVTGDTVYDALKVETRPSADGNYITTGNTAGANLTALDVQVKTNTDAIASVTDGMDGKANTSLDNVTSAGQDVIRTLAKGSVKVVDGTHTTVTEGTDGDAKTYVVNVSADGLVADGDTGIVTGGAVYNALQTQASDTATALDTKANKDASNVTDAEAWGTKIATGSVAENDVKAVSGDTVYRMKTVLESAVSDGLDGKANVGLDNISTAGEGVVKDLAKGSVNVVGGAYATVDKSDVNGVDIYTVNVDTSGAVTDGDMKLVTGGAVYNALQTQASDMATALDTKANKDASNVTDAVAWGTKIATGSVAENDVRAISGDTAYRMKTALETAMNIGLNSKADNDLSNLTDAGQAVIQQKAISSVKVGDGNNTTVSSETDADGNIIYKVKANATGTVAANDTGLVDGGTVYEALENTKSEMTGSISGKADKDLGNITDAGKEVVKDLAKDSVSVESGTNAEVVKTDVNGVDMYTVNVAGNGQVAENNTGLMSGGTMYNELRPADGNYVRKDATTAVNLSALDTKIGSAADGTYIRSANTVGQNLNVLDEVLYDKANRDASNIGRNLLVADGEYPDGLTDEQKAEYASNLREYNLRSWGQALGAGTVTGGDARLITGDTLHVEVRPANSGTYVRVDKTTGENLLALDEQLSSVVNGSSAQSTAISDLENEMANKANIALDNINSDGVNVVRNIAKSAVVVADGPNTTVSSSTDTDGNITYRVTANATGSVTDGNTGLVDGGMVYTAIENAKGSMGGDIGGLDADGNYIRKANTVAQNLVALDTQVKTNADGLAAEQTARETADTALSNRIGTLTADGNYIVKDSSVSENLSRLDTAVKTAGDTADANAAAIADLKDLSNITAAGETVIKDLAKGSVKVINGTNTMVTEGMDGDVKTFAVNVAPNGAVADGDTGLVSGGTVKSALDALSGSVDAGLAGKATVSLDNLDADGHTVIKSDAKSVVNVVGSNRASVTKTDVNGVDTYTVDVKADGEILADNKGLVDGGTVFDAVAAVTGNIIDYTNDGLAGKANVDLDNLAATGHAVIKSDAKSAVNVTGGQYATVTKTDVDGVDTYTVNVATDGSVTDGNEKLVTGGTVYDALQGIRGSVDTAMAGKANTSLDNLDVAGVGRIRDIAKTAVSVANGAHTTASSETDADGNVTYRVNVDLDGSVASGNSGVVSGGGIYNELRPADGNYVAQSNTTAANLTALDVAVKEAMTKAETAQAAAGGNVVLYDGDDKSAVTLGGTDGTVIHNVADGAVSADSKDAVNGGQLYTVKSSVDANTTAIAGLDTKIQDHATAIAGLNTRVQDNATAIAGLDTRVQDNATAIAGLDTRVQDNATAIDTLRTTVTDGLNGKADTDLGNLSDTGKETVRGLAKESVRVADGLNTTVRTTVDGNASVYHVDVATTGRVESGNAGIVTGDAVYEALRDLELNASDTHYVSVNPSERDDETYTNHGASGTDAVAVGAKSYARGEESVAIGHNNDVSGNETYVIGSDVNATGNHSVVLGKGSDGSLDNVVSVGSAGNERRIVHVADGKLSADSKDAVNGKQLYEVREKLQNAEGIDVDKWSDALGSGSVAPDDDRLVKGSTVYSAIQSFSGISLSPDGSTLHVGANNTATVVDFSNSEGNGRVLQGVVTDPDNPNSAANVGYVNAVGQNIIHGVNNSLNRMDTRIDKVGAGAAALASLEPMPFDDNQKWSISAAIGTYHGIQAGAVGVFYKPQDNVMLNIRGAVGNGENMGGAGLSIGLNKGAVKGLSKASMAKAMNAQANEIVAQKQLIQNQQAQLDAQKAEIEELKQMVRSVVASKQVDK